MLLLRQQSTLKPLTPQTLPTYSNVIDDAVRNAGLSGDGAAVPGGVGVWGATTPLYVSGFETTIADWSAGGPIGTETFAQDTAHVKFGTKALKCTTPGGVVGEGAQNVSFSGLTGGSAYAQGVWVWAPTGATLTALWRTTGQGISASTNFTGNNAWQFVPCAGAALSTGAQSGRPQIITQGSAQAISFWIDGVQFESGSIATPFIGNGNASRAAARIQVPASVLSAQQGWVFAAVKMGVGNSVVGPRLVSFSDGTTNNRIEMFAGGGGWQSRKVQGGVAGANATLTDAYNLGDVRVLGIRYDPQTIALSGQGSAWPTNQASNANVPVGLNTLTLGSFADGTSPLDSALLCVIAGRIPPDNPLAVYNLLSSGTPPGLGALNPAWGVRFYWSCVNSTAYAAA